MIGEVLGRPDIQIEPYSLNLKISSKLAFLARENVDRIIMQNLSFDGARKAFQMKLTDLLSMTRNSDVSFMKSRFYELKSKMIIPEIMLEESFTMEEIKEISDIKQ